MTDCAEYLFGSSLAVRVPPIVKCPIGSFPIFKLDCFLITDYKNVHTHNRYMYTLCYITFRICWIQPFVRCIYTDIFLPVHGLHFYFLYDIFQRAEVFNFDEIQFMNFILL